MGTLSLSRSPLRRGPRDLDLLPVRARVSHTLRPTVRRPSRASGSPAGVAFQLCCHEASPPFRGVFKTNNHLFLQASGSDWIDFRLLRRRAPAVPPTLGPCRGRERWRVLLHSWRRPDAEVLGPGQPSVLESPPLNATPIPSQTPPMSLPHSGLFGLPWLAHPPPRFLTSGVATPHRAKPTSSERTPQRSVRAP